MRELSFHALRGMRTVISSTAIADFAYDPDTACLTVTFVSGRVYEYYDVPLDVAVDFQSAPSKGTFFNARIRDRYRYEEIRKSRGLKRDA
jgi:hypothetical protein